MQVSGFNLRRFITSGSKGMNATNNNGEAAASKRLLPILEALMKLIDAGLLCLAYTE